MAHDKFTSRIPGFYKQSIGRRLSILSDSGILSPESQAHLSSGRGLSVEVADRMSENVIGCQSLPVSVALNFRVNQKDVLVPMAVEEPSIVAAASNAARLVRISGGFFGSADDPIMTTQVQLDEVPNPALAEERILAAKEELLVRGNESIPRMVERGGGCRDLAVRVLDEAEGVVVVDLFVDVGDAMGANIVDTVAEHVAPHVHAITKGKIGLRILSNLPLRRMVSARACVSEDAVGGVEIAEGIARASRFAELDPFRAVTHNKGIMNGIDAVAVALGQDWRAIEAGAHGFAALSRSGDDQDHRGRYRPLAIWKRTPKGLEGTIEMPLAAATVGGSTHSHLGVRAAFEIIKITGVKELSVVMASAGLACNLAALRALAGEGIQRGHLELHQRKQLQESESVERSS